MDLLKGYDGFFNRELKVWNLPFNKYLPCYNEFKIKIDPEIKISLIDEIPLNIIMHVDDKIITFKPDGEKKQFTLDYLNDPKKTLFELPPSMYSTLYNFQKKGIEFGIRRDGRFLLADEMGVGKTIQAIGCTSIFLSDWPVLIICPSSLKYAWRDEISNWLKDLVNEKNIQIMNSSKDEFKDNISFFIVSYDLSVRIEDKLKEKNFNFIIADEVHYLKNRNAKRSKILLPLMQKSKRLILLSGTPILAKPVECFTLLKALRPDIFLSFKAFGNRYCDAKMTNFGMDFNGSSNAKELNFILNNLMIRRLKKDVLSELPPKKRQKVTISTDEKIVNQIRVLLNKTSKMVIPENIEENHNEGINSFTKAYSLTGMAKIKGINEYLNYLVESIILNYFQ